MKPRIAKHTELIRRFSAIMDSKVKVGFKGDKKTPLRDCLGAYIDTIYEMHCAPPAVAKKSK